MSKWNHRVIQTTTSEGENIFAIHEVHYTETNEVWTWTERPVPVKAFSSEGLEWTLKQMLLALKKPVLVETDYEI